MKVLVVGAGGFLGRYLVRQIAEVGHEVVALIRSEPAPEDESFFKVERVRLLRMDLLRPDLSALPGDIDAVVALAQSEHFRKFPDKAEEIFAINVTATMSLLQWAAKNRVQKFIFASSGGIYGSNARPYVQETELLAVDSPLGFYLGTKLCAEIIFQNYRQFFETAVILRPFFIYGPGQRLDMFIPRLINSVFEGRPIQLQGEAGVRLNPIYVEDAAQAFANAIALRGCYVMNIAGPDVLSIREICEHIGKLCARIPIFEQMPGVPSDYVASTDLAKTLLSLPQTPLSYGLKQTVDSVLRGKKVSEHG